MTTSPDATSADTQTPATGDEDTEAQNLLADAIDGTDDGDGDEVDGEGTEQLGDPGKRALDSMKTKWRTERDKRKAAEAELEELRNGAKKDGGQASPDQVRLDAEHAATVKANARILRSEVRAAATGKLADPKDALTFLNLDQFEVGEDGQVDTDEIADAIDDLLKTKPYLAAATAKRFQGTGDNGAASRKAKPKQLTENDLKTMTAEQIVKAQAEGRCDDLLGVG